MRSNMQSNRFGVIVLVIGFCAIVGMFSGGKSERTTIVPTRTPAQPTSQAYEVNKSCDKHEWTTNTLEVIELFEGAISLPLVDALIVKYDSLKAPLCDDNELAQEIDAEVRVALANKRTALMTSGETANKNMAMAVIRITSATNLLAKYTSQP